MSASALLEQLLASEESQKEMDLAAYDAMVVALALETEAPALDDVTALLSRVAKSAADLNSDVRKMRYRYKVARDEADSIAIAMERREIEKQIQAKETAFDLIRQEQAQQLRPLQCRIDEINQKLIEHSSGQYARHELRLNGQAVAELGKVMRRIALTTDAALIEKLNAEELHFLKQV